MSGWALLEFLGIRAIDSKSTRMEKPSSTGQASEINVWPGHRQKVGPQGASCTGLFRGGAQLLSPSGHQTEEGPTMAYVPLWKSSCVTQPPLVCCSQQKTPTLFSWRCPGSCVFKSGQQQKARSLSGRSTRRSWNREHDFLRL